MGHIALEDAQAWAEPTKLTLGSLDEDLEGQIATAILNRIATAYDVSAWVSSATTPYIIRSVIAMMYVSWYYDRAYSEDDGASEYAKRLATMAEGLLVGILNGSVEVGETPEQVGPTTVPSFYPNDVSSATVPTVLDPSLGPASFSMGIVF